MFNFLNQIPVQDIYFVSSYPTPSKETLGKPSSLAQELDFTFIRNRKSVGRQTVQILTLTLNDHPLSTSGLLYLTLAKKCINNNKTILNK